MPDGASVRDRAVLCLSEPRNRLMGRGKEGPRPNRQLSSHRIAALRYDDVALVDPVTKYVEVKRMLIVRGRALVVDDAAAEVLNRCAPRYGYAPHPKTT